MTVPLGFTWVRISGEPDETGMSPGLYVSAAEVAAYLREYEAADVAAALDQLQRDNLPATTSGWLFG